MKWPPPDPALLAQAIDRAADRPVNYRSEDAPEGFATVREIASHLDWSEWGVQTGCRRLVRDELAERRRDSHFTYFGLTPDGDAWLAGIEDELPELPEDPTHRRWREKRAEAERDLPTLREKVREASRVAVAAADAETLDALGMKVDRFGPRSIMFGESVGEQVERAIDELADALHMLTRPEPPA